MDNITFARVTFVFDIGRPIVPVSRYRYNTKFNEYISFIKSVAERLAVIR